MSDQQDAAFEAAFAEARGEELPTIVNDNETAADAVNEIEETQAEDQAQAVEVEDETAKAFAKIPELEAYMQSEIRKVYGKFGEMTQALKEVQGAANGKAKLKITEQFKSEYPELAEMFDSFEVEGATGGNHATDESQFNDKLSKVEQNFELKLLTMQHKDWKQVAGSEGFAEWVSKQDAETQQLLSTTWDAIFVSEKLTEYKNAIAAAAPPATAGKPNRNARLEDALTPEGVATSPRTVNEADEFEKGFNKARGL